MRTKKTESRQRLLSLGIVEIVQNTAKKEVRKRKRMKKKKNSIPQESDEGSFALSKFQIDSMYHRSCMRVMFERAYWLLCVMFSMIETVREGTEQKTVVKNHHQQNKNKLRDFCSKREQLQKNTLK